MYIQGQHATITMLGVVAFLYVYLLCLFFSHKQIDEKQFKFIYL